MPAKSRKTKMTVKAHDLKAKHDPKGGKGRKYGKAGQADFHDIFIYTLKRQIESRFSWLNDPAVHRGRNRAEQSLTSLLAAATRTESRLPGYRAAGLQGHIL